MVGPVLFVATVAGAFIGWQAYQQQNGHAGPSQTKTAPPKPPGGVERVSEDTLSVTPVVVRSLGFRTTAAKAADHPRNLPALQGTLGWDLNRLTRVYSPFPGIVVSLGTTDKGETEKPFASTGPRALHNGDRVGANQLLAVVWSKELGEKKSELMDAISQLKVNRENLTRLKSLSEGIVERKRIIEAEGAVRLSENAIARAVETLRAWRLDEAEINAIVREAEKISSGEARRELTAGKTWARVEIRAPFAGTLIEKNTNIRNMVDTTTPLFQIADLSKLTVWALAYENDLTVFQKLPKPIGWEVRLPSRSDYHFTGKLEQIGAIIDPVQRTALVSGTVDNRDGSLKVGQLVSVTVAVPPVAGEIEIPTAALIEDGQDSVVFVQPDPAVLRFTRRPVVVTRRYYDVAYLAAPSANGGVQAGDLVVTTGALQLNQVLADAGPGSRGSHR